MDVFLNNKINKINSSIENYRIASDRQGIMRSLSDGVVTGSTFRIAHITKQTIRDIIMCFVNYYTPDGYTLEVTGTNNITIKASLEYNGVIYPIFFNGLRSVVLQPSQTVICDDIPIVIPANATFYIRTYVSVNSGEKFPLGLSTIYSRGEGYDTTDKVDSGTITAQSYYNSYHPVYVIGKVNKSNAIMLIGDSIAQGTSQYPDGGYLRNALYGIVPYNIVAVPGTRAQNFTTYYRQRRMRIAKYCRYAICEYGINDLVGGRTLEQIQADLLEIWNTLNSYGIKVFQTTITPNTTSTDSWATTVNQTVKSFESIRVQLNNWIRTTPTPLSGYFDATDLAETARNSGIWKSGYTVDGLHPNPTGHNAMVSCIDTSKFVEVL